MGKSKLYGSKGGVASLAVVRGIRWRVRQPWGAGLVALGWWPGLSQEALAAHLGVSRQAVTKWESGETTPDLDNLVALGRLLGTTLDFLVRDEGDCGVETEQGLDVSRDLSSFLCRAKRATYAGKGAEVAPSRPSAHDLRYQEGGLEYYDTYLGSERFAGEEAVWEGGVPLWAMNYCGRVLKEGFSGDFLKAALFQVDPALPFRGPRLFRELERTYHCEVTGDFEWFHGVESIFLGDERMYECRFHGGLVR